MKRSRIILLVTLLVLSSVLMTSCAGAKIKPIEDISDVLNVDYDLSSEPYTKSSEITALAGAVTDTTDASDEFIIFAIQDEEIFTDVTYKVLSLRSNSVILDFKADEKTQYSFDLIDGFPAFLVTKTVTSYADELELVPEITNNYYLYDASAQLVDSSETISDVDYLSDLLVYDGVAYSADKENGKLVKEIEIPEYMNVAFIVDYNDTYFYGATENEVLYVYDREFKRVSSWAVPNFGDDSIYDMQFFILNNGDMIVQYYVILDEDTAKYDLTIVDGDETIKADLVSELISAADGSSKELKLDYIIDEVIRNTDLYDDDEAAEDNYFVNTFENIAVIRPVVDGKILSSAADENIVFMDNEAKFGKSLKILANQAAELPSKIADDLYSVTMLDGGITIIDSEGEIVNSMNSVLPVVGSYFVGTKAIYDMDLKPVYDLTKKDVSVLDTLGDTILIKSGNEISYSIIALRDGKEQTIYTHTKSSTSSFEVIGDSVYCIMDDNGNYSYYNEAGDKITSSTTELVYIHESYEHDKIILVSVPADIDGKVAYFVFSK